ncbi:TnpV protein [Streptococcus suis]|uniref:TnpV protein n=1 Tax=Streptococcus suis TaxID=1307 RepID=UPI003D2FD506
MEYLSKEESNVEMLLELYQTAQLIPHLMEVEKEAKTMGVILEQQLIQEWNLTEELKSKDMLKWTAQMNNLRSSIKEQVRYNLIYI